MSTIVKRLEIRLCIFKSGLLCLSQHEVLLGVTDELHQNFGAPGIPQHPSGHPDPPHLGGSGRTCYHWGWATSSDHLPENVPVFKKEGHTYDYEALSIIINNNGALFCVSSIHANLLGWLGIVVGPGPSCRTQQPAPWIWADCRHQSSSLDRNQNEEQRADIICYPDHLPIPNGLHIWAGGSPSGLCRKCQIASLSLIEGLAQGQPKVEN